MNQKGLVHIYCGDGKGKTTAAVGLAVRAAGYGMKVLVAQLMKDGSSSEISALRGIPGIEIMETPHTSKFIFAMAEAEYTKYKADVEKCWGNISAAMAEGQYDLVVIDELCSAVSTGVISAEAAAGAISGRNEHVEVVITGRDPDEKLRDCADYISEIHKIKHPFDEGISARNGIEK